MTHANRSELEITLTEERPDTAESMALIAELDAELDPLYDQENRHGYSVEKLLREDVHFFVLRYDDPIQE